MPNPGNPPALATPDEMLSRLERAVADSPADATEIAWLEVRRGQESVGKRRREGWEQRERTLLVRVRERGRTGFHRTGETGPADIAAAVREALALARLQPAGDALLPDPTPEPLPPERVALPDLYDEAVARLDPAGAKASLQRLGGRCDSARLTWCNGRVAVAASATRTVQCARATAVSLEVGRGRRAGAGRAAAAARSLAALDVRFLLERAQAREGPEELADLPAAGAPLLLAPEAAAALLGLLNRLALSSAAYPSSPLAGRLGQAVVSAAVSLRDDGTDPEGLPFPFDLLGVAKRPVDLISAGRLCTPAVDARLAAEIGRPVTPHAVSSQEALATHLFLLPGSQRDEELARQLGEGALWIGALDPSECFDPAGLRFRAVARGVRRIENGALGRSLPDLVWEDSLLEALGRVLATGAYPTVLPGADLLLGGLSAPSLALARAASLVPLVI